VNKVATAGVAALFLFLCLPQIAFSQVNAVVGGTVSDAGNALIPGVEVTATNVNTGIVTTRITNETGNYEFPNLQPGVYSVKASLTGFQTSTYNNVQLSQNQQVRLNFTMQVSGVAQSVEVVAEANTLLSTTAASVGNVLAEQEVSRLPVPSRNVLDLLGAIPGAVGHNTVNGNSDIHFAGGLTNQINTTRDGLVTTDGRYDNGVYSSVFTSADLVEEVQVVLNNVDATSGRGSGQVRMQTRSGTNEFHGAAFYTNNNSSLNSQAWFDNLVGAEKNFENRNQFGGRLGGPIKKNKAFFFVLVDEQRYVEKVNVVSTVLTDTARQGIFRYLTANAPGSSGGIARQTGNAFSTTPSVDLNGRVLTSDPQNGTPLFSNSFSLFSDVRDPNRSRIDPRWFGPQMLPRMPLPNDWTVGDGLNTAGYRWHRRHDGLEDLDGTSPNVNRDHLTARLDYQINPAHKVTYTMTREENWGVTGQTGLPAFPQGYFGDVRRIPDFYTAAWTATVSPTVVNEFRWGRKRDSWRGTSPFDKGCCWGGKSENDDLAESAREARASFPSIHNQLFYIAPGSGLGAYAPFGTSSPRDQLSPLMQISNTTSWIKGAHSFQAGVETTLTGTNQNNHGAAGVGTTRPLATLGVGNVPVPNVTTTAFPGLHATSITTAQNLLASLAGSIATINHQYFINSASETDWLDYRTTFIRVRNLRKNDWAAFFKDNWKVTGHLTLNFGLRYDKYGTPYDTTGLGGRPKGGQAGLFGISGTDFGAMWNPYSAGGALTTVELAGKHSPNPNVLIFPNDWNDFAPSFGFSWSIPGLKRSTVLRGGYGINFTGASSFLSYSAQIGNIPGSTLGITYSPSNYLDVSMVSDNLVPLATGGAKPWGPVPLTNRTAGLSGYADDRITPYVQSFNLSLQRELVKNLTLDVSWVGTKGTKLWSSEELNYANIFENGILDAFNVTRSGGNAALFDRIFNGLTVPGAGVVNGTSLTGSQALRRYTTTNQWLANGEAGAFANWLNSTSALTNENGGLLRRVGLPENFVVVNPQFGSVSLQGNSGNSTYHSMQTQLSERFSQDFTGKFTYTWSKTLGNSGTRNPRDRHLDKGRLTFDRTHNVKAHGTWTLPFGANRRLLANAPSIIQRIVSEWEVSGIFSWNSGAPLGFTTSRATLSNGLTNTADPVGELSKGLGKAVKRTGFVEYFSGLSVKTAGLPDYGGDTSLPGRFTNQVVLDQAGQVILQNARPGTAGSLGQTLPFLSGPGSLGLDMALSKRIRVAERKTFTIRADAINILNTPQWDNPNTDINSSNFGRITAAGGSRTITINARVDF
jgi:hypothetical protein